MRDENSEQSDTLEDEKSGPKMAPSSPPQKAKISKTDARYWLQPGKLVFHNSPDYSARIQAEGRREWFALASANKRVAASKAAEIFLYVKAHGFDAAVSKFKPKDEGTPLAAVTVGNFINKACELSTARSQSLEAYSKAFRLIVSEVMGITLKTKKGSKEKNAKYDADSGGQKAWKNLIDTVPLHCISPSEILAWKNSRLKDSEADPITKRRTIVTVNSLIRNSKALFGKKILPFIDQDLQLSRPLPFDGITLEKSPSLRYHSNIDAFGILALAKDELSTNEPEVYKVIILSLVCGLRRSEMDSLLWRSFDFSKSILRVVSTEYHELKSEDSAGVIDLDEDTLRLFKDYRKQAPADVFVIRSKKLSRGKGRSYRCDPTFNRAIEWMKEKGVENDKPIHTLRKEIGSIIASEHGIFEASRYLRHSDIRITAAIYADKKKIVTPKTFSGLL